MFFNPLYSKRMVSCFIKEFELYSVGHGQFSAIMNSIGLPAHRTKKSVNNHQFQNATESFVRIRRNNIECVAFLHGRN